MICEEGINRLIEAIKTDLDKFSLRPIHFSVGDDEFYFGGLDMNMIHRVFLGNKIAIFGDSTLRNLLTWLRFLLLLTVQSHSLLAKGGISTKNLSNAVYEIKKLNKKIDKSEIVKDRLDSLKHSPPMDSYEIAVGYSLTSTQFDYALQYMTIYKPKVVIANIGLHLLHIQNYGHDMGYKTVESWLNYEKTLEQFVVAAENAGVETLALKTSNFICDEKYTREFAKGVHLYSAQNRQAIKKCVTSIRKEEHLYKSSSATITVQNIRNYCTNAVLNEKGSSDLNERLYRFVNDRRKQQQQQHSISSPSTKLVIFNDNKLQSCETTRRADARHHQILNLARIRLLANLFDCMHQ